MSEEKEVSFKVTDRRLFNPDGTVRAEFIESEAKRQAAEAASPTAEETVRKPSAGVPGAEQPELSPIFLDFVMSLVSSAAASLGMVEHPATGKKVVDLPTARQMIDLLGVLREKTRGNLTREEERLFDGSLAELRMRFVQLANKRQ